MNTTILLSIIALLLINEISITSSLDRESFIDNVDIDALIAKEVVNIPSKRDKYDIQFKMYIKQFNNLTNLVKDKDYERKLRDKTIQIQRNLIESYNKEINTGNRNNETGKRIGEIEVRGIGEALYKKKLAVHSIILIICLTIILLLYKADKITKKAAVVLYVLGLIAIALYVFYKLYITQSNVDDHYYKKYNFVKPTKEEVLLSKLNYEKSLRKNNERSVDDINNNIPANSIDISEYINDMNEKCSQ